MLNENTMAALRNEPFIIHVLFGYLNIIVRLRYFNDVEKILMNKRNREIKFDNIRHYVRNNIKIQNTK